MKISLLRFVATIAAIVALAACQQPRKGTDDSAVVAVRSVEIDNPDPTIDVGGTTTLKASVLPLQATDRTVVWHIDDPSVATIDPEMGAIKGLAKGTATITVTTKSGGKIASCRITVSETEDHTNPLELTRPVESISFPYTPTEIIVGDRLFLHPTILPENADNKGISWSSSAPNIIEVDAVTGALRAVAKGEATITVTTDDGAKTANCTLVVTKPTGEHMITMSTAKQGEVKISFVTFNYDPVTIDWGDGRGWEKISSGQHTHFYSDPSPHNIIIKGYLWELRCHGNDLTALDVSGCTSLNKLDCDYNRLTTLDVTGCRTLTELYCPTNRLTTLSTQGCTSLKWLDCFDNILTTMDISASTALTWFYGDGNRLTALDVTNNTALGWLQCSDSRLTSLDVRRNSALVALSCDNNRLTALEVTNNPKLEALRCGSNAIKNLDVTANPALQQLDCFDNQLSSLDVTHNPALWWLDCKKNGLTTLDVSGNPVLRKLNCRQNRLTTLDLRENGALAWLTCSLNQFTAESLDAMFRSLHANPIDADHGRIIYLASNPGTAECGKSIATAKGWEVDTVNEIGDEPIIVHTSPFRNEDYPDPDRR